MKNAPDDLLLVHARREAVLILVAWAICFAYSATYCYLFGYSIHNGGEADSAPSVGSMVGPLPSFQRTTESLTLPLGLGIPDWVFFGVVVPWLVCIAFTFVFCLFVFADDDLGETDDE